MIPLVRPSLLLCFRIVHGFFLVVAFLLYHICVIIRTFFSWSSFIPLDLDPNEDNLVHCYPTCQTKSTRHPLSRTLRSLPLISWTGLSIFLLRFLISFNVYTYAFHLHVPHSDQTPFSFAPILVHRYLFALRSILRLFYDRVNKKKYWFLARAFFRVFRSSSSLSSRRIESLAWVGYPSALDSNVVAWVDFFSIK